MAANAIQPGDLVRLRSRNWLVEESEKSKAGTILRLACVEDDSQGEPLQVVAEVELGIKKLDEEAIQKIGKKGNGKASGKETANIAAITKHSENGHTNLYPMLFTHLPQLTY